MDERYDKGDFVQVDNIKMTVTKGTNRACAGCAAEHNETLCDILCPDGRCPLNIGYIFKER